MNFYICNSNHWFVFQGSKNIMVYLLITLFLISDEAYIIATIRDNVQTILVFGDVLWLTKWPNPCKVVLPANSLKTFKTTIASRLSDCKVQKLKLNRNATMIFAYYTRTSLTRPLKLKRVHATALLTAEDIWF